MYFPKIDEIYGSEFIYLKVDEAMNAANTSYMQSFKMRKTHWKALDTPDKRCDEGYSEANTTHCLTSYLERTVGCSMGLSGGNPHMTM